MTGAAATAFTQLLMLLVLPSQLHCYQETESDRCIFKPLSLISIKEKGLKD